MASKLSEQFAEIGDLPADFVALATAIADLPDEHRRRLSPIFQRLLKATHRRRELLHQVQDALTQLRLDMKYLMFDLEATRRERDAGRGNK